MTNILITGASRGIGRLTARLLVEQGHTVFAGMRHIDGRNAHAAADLSDYSDTVPGRIVPLALDVTDAEQIAVAVNLAEAEGPIDVLINNAGVGGGGLRSMIKVPLDDLHALMNVNFFGVWHGATEFGRRFVAQGEAAMILNVGSENSFFNAMPKMAAYIASKHAVRGMTEAMREEFPDFIQIGLICPGLVQSDMTANMGSLGMPADEFAGRILKQVKAGAFYLVGHAYNIERIKPIHDQIEDAYARNAPRYDGDDEYDVPTLIARLTAGRDGT